MAFNLLRFTYDVMNHRFNHSEAAFQHIGMIEGPFPASCSEPQCLVFAGQIPWVVPYRLVHSSAPVSHICLHLHSPCELFTSIQTLAIQRTERRWASRLDWPQIRGNTTPPSQSVSEAAGHYRQISTLQPRRSSTPQTLLQMVHKGRASVSAFIQLRPAHSHLCWLEMYFKCSVLSLVYLFHRLLLGECFRSLCCLVWQYFFTSWYLICCSFKWATNRFMCKEVIF